MFGIDLIALIKTAGYVGLFAIIFAETGLFFGFSSRETACFSPPASSPHKS